MLIIIFFNKAKKTEENETSYPLENKLNVSVTIYDIWYLF